MHKLKFTMGTLEILAAAGISFLTSDVPAALNMVSNIAKLRSLSVNLREQEGKSPGKEIAYIYHANKSFRLASMETGGLYQGKEY